MKKVIESGFPYAQARVQARFGDLPDAPDWRRVAQSVALGSYLQSANATGLGAYLVHLGPDSDSHAIELAMRQAFRGRVEEVALWVPDSWQAAVRWFGLLLDLEVIAAFVAARETDVPLTANLPGWLLADRFLVHLAAADVGAMGGGETHIATAWRSEWLDRWGDMADASQLAMRSLSGILPFACYDPDLQQWLSGLFRKSGGQPAAVFAYLGLVLMVVMRLRGELLQRRMLPETGIA